MQSTRTAQLHLYSHMSTIQGLSVRCLAGLQSKPSTISRPKPQTVPSTHLAGCCSASSRRRRSSRHLSTSFGADTQRSQVCPVPLLQLGSGQCLICSSCCVVERRACKTTSKAAQLFWMKYTHVWLSMQNDSCGIDVLQTNNASKRLICI